MSSQEVKCGDLVINLGTSELPALWPIALVEKEEPSDPSEVIVRLPNGTSVYNIGKTSLLVIDHNCTLEDLRAIAKTKTAKGLQILAREIREVRDLALVATGNIEGHKDDPHKHPPHL